MRLTVENRAIPARPQPTPNPTLAALDIPGRAGNVPMPTVGGLKEGELGGLKEGELGGLADGNEGLVPSHKAKQPQEQK